MATAIPHCPRGHVRVIVHCCAGLRCGSSSTNQGSITSIAVGRGSPEFVGGAPVLPEPRWPSLAGNRCVNGPKIGRLHSYGGLWPARYRHLHGASIPHTGPRNNLTICCRRGHWVLCEYTVELRTHIWLWRHSRDGRQRLWHCNSHFDVAFRTDHHRICFE